MGVGRQRRHREDRETLRHDRRRTGLDHLVSGRQERPTPRRAAGHPRPLVGRRELRAQPRKIRWMDWVGIAALVTAIGGILGVIWSHRASKKEATDKAEEECRERLKQARAEA